ncbi:hypothetical protein Y032_0190g1266 [Ancylostoma ceylanicum]|uniref:Uncharacterized protein n=2 Tax=Ancylostoma ceylanicum TaxID=53326 RepID=A0A016SQY6_9BILA|nr:hypothetical protein Y032_0190g1266 [Ancylostoma ceylanicum]
MRLLLSVALLAAANSVLAGAAGSRQAQVNRAIEQTKSRQMAAPVGRAPSRSQNSPGRNEAIDVDKLNQLIHAVDKTWIFPRLGAKEPVGSNFQYKKTCASIFKARHGACQQLGFGVMCFNYCHERGEKLSFRCQDASDAAYCRQSGTFETFLAKYRKDGYKAKAYIHQMISRCYATTICNTQTGILNSTLINEDVLTETTTRMNRHRLLTRGPKASKPRATTTTAAPEETEYVEVESEEVETTTRRRPAEKKKATRAKPTTTPAPAKVTASKSNIWDRFTVSPNSKVSSKNIPFWKRLLSTTTGAPKSAEEVVEESVEPETTTEPSVEDGEEAVDVTEAGTSEATTPVEDNISTNRPVQKTDRNTGTTQKVQETTSREKHTFKPLPMTVPPPQGPEMFQKAGERGPAFWNRFQPNRWFESIHYVTNTGK